MPKAPTVRRELIDFLASLPSPITMPIPDLFEAWLAWREEHGLPSASEKIRAFRGILARLEALGEIRITRTAAGKFGPIELSKPPEPGDAERVRALERERAILHSRFFEASKGAGKDLYAMRTPALNAYVRRRRTIEEARRSFTLSGMDPNLVAADLDPLGEEALALKERVLRLEIEVLAWRELANRRGLRLELPATPVPLGAVEEEPAPAQRRRKVAEVSRG